MVGGECSEREEVLQWLWISLLIPNIRLGTLVIHKKNGRHIAAVHL